MKEEAKLKIREGIELLKNYNFPNYKTIEEAIACIREAINQIKKENESGSTGGSTGGG